MPVTTTISLPEKLAREVDQKIKQGRFASRSEFFREAVRNYLTLQETIEEKTWEEFAKPFRRWARRKNLTEKDILDAVMEGRYANSSRGRS